MVIKIVVYRRTTLKIGLACLLGFGFVRNAKTYRRNTEMRKLSRSRTLHKHRYYFEDRRTTLKIGLAWFFWVWLRSEYKKLQKKRRNAKIEPFKVSYCFEDRRTTLKIGLACLLGFGFVRDTKTYGRNNEMRKLSRSRTLHEHRYYFEDRRTTLKIGLAHFFGFGFVRNTKTYRRNTEMRKLSRSRHRYCFEDRRATLKIGLACFFGFGFVRSTKNHRRSTEMRKLSRSRPLHEHGYPSHHSQNWFGSFFGVWLRS